MRNNDVIGQVIVSVRQSTIRNNCRGNERVVDWIELGNGVRLMTVAIETETEPVGTLVKNVTGLKAKHTTAIYKKLTAMIGAALVLIATVQAGDKEKVKREPEPNYIYRRQQAGLVQGTPIRSFYVDHRRIDTYRDGSVWEKDSRVK